MKEDIEKQYSSRLLLYENKDTFYEILSSQEEEDSEYKELNDSIVKGQQLLTNAILELNGALLEKKRIEDTIKSVRTTQHGIQQSLEHLKNTALSNEVTIEGMQDTLDQASYSGSYVTDAIEVALKERLSLTEKKITDARHVLKSLGKAYNVLKNTGVGCTCPVCMNAQVEVYIDPCGHTFCQKCSKKIYTNCGFCRAPIKKVNKLFFV
jgi:hypothetical protein